MAFMMANRFGPQGLDLLFFKKKQVTPHKSRFSLLFIGNIEILNEKREKKGK